MDIDNDSSGENKVKKMFRRRPSGELLPEVTGPRGTVLQVVRRAEMADTLFCFSCCIAEQPQPIITNSLDQSMAESFKVTLRRPPLYVIKLSYQVCGIISDPRNSLHINVMLYEKRRHRIDRSMIGQPTDFRHTGHIGSRDIGNGVSSSMNTMSEVQSQMSSKGGYDHVSPVNVNLNVIDLPHKHNGTELMS